VNIIVIRFQLFESDNNSHQFHTVIGGFTEAFGKGLLVFFSGHTHQNSVTAWSWISATSTVSKDFDF
jgi:hypothetical protein